jgi:hypothetical protein
LTPSLSWPFLCQQMIRIVTMATDVNRAEYKYLLGSNKTPWSIENVGIDAKTGLAVPWTGWLGRVRQYRDAAQRAVQAGAEMACFIDGYDVLMHPKASDRLGALVRELTTHGGLHEILAGAERSLHGKFTDIGAYHKSMPHDERSAMELSGQKCVQMGTVCGVPEALVRMYDWILESGYTDDQIAMGHYLNAVGWPTVKLDYAGALMQTSGHVVKLDMDSLGCSFVHFPGPTGLGISLAYNETIRDLFGKPWGLINYDSIVFIVLFVLAMGFQCLY